MLLLLDEIKNTSCWASSEVPCGLKRMKYKGSKKVSEQMEFKVGEGYPGV